MESKVQGRQSGKREPVWVPEDTAEPLPLLALGLPAGNRRYLDAAAVFI